MADPIKPAAPEFKEVATVQRDITFPSFLGRLTNRDDTLIQRGGGKGLKIYDEIERDCHAFAVLQKRKLAVIARPWEVEPASSSALDKRAADIVRAQLKAIDFDRLTLDLLDANLKGYAVSEVMWEARGAELVAARTIARDQRRFVFDDEYRLRMLTMENLVEGELMPDRKFVWHSFGAKDASPYGLGLGTRLFWPVFFKRQDIVFWLTFADKFGSPTALGKYPAGSQPGEVKTLLDALAAIAQDAGVAVPEGMMVELLEATRGGATDTYEKLAKYMDDQMSEATLGETMSTSSKSAGIGSSQAQVHNEVRLELVKADADLLSGALNRTLVRWISEYNVPGATPPTVYRKVEEPKDTTALADRDKTICEMGFKPSLTYIQETYGGDWVVAPPPATHDNPAADALGTAASFAEAAAAIATPGQAVVDRAAASPPAVALNAQVQTALAPVLDLVKGGASYEDIMAKLAQTFPAMDTDGLEELLARAIFVGDLWGQVEVSEAADAAAA